MCNYVYHDDMDYGELRPIIEKRESKWLELIQRFDKNKGLAVWTEDEIEDVIGEIQEYILLDYPDEKKHTIRQLRDALDGLARVTLMLFRAYQGHDKKFDCDYSSKKLYSVLMDLQPKELMPNGDMTAKTQEKVERTTRINFRGKSI